MKNFSPPYLLHPAYFPMPEFFARVVKGPVLFEAEDNYQKQTFRNRMLLYSPGGLQKLTVPIKHTGNSRQKYREVRLDNSFNWKRQHWRTLETCYRTSPFFEYYEDDLYPFFTREFEFLYEMNIASIELLASLFQIPFEPAYTQMYKQNPEGVRDDRILIDAKNRIPPKTPEYLQVFSDKYGFLPNLSALDLLCNEGPRSKDYIIALSEDL